MPLFYQQNINENTRLAIWQITEPLDFFLKEIPVQHKVTHKHKQLQHAAGRYLLPFLFDDFPYDEILIADTRKPYLPDEQYHFSISHCGNYAAAIVSRYERVGIDIEMPQEKIVNISTKFMHPDEFLFVRYGGDLIATTTLLWSAKEAMYKWWGMGKIDFKEMLRIESTDSITQTLHANFQNLDITQPLLLHYRFLQQLCMVWLTTPALQ
ncbi:MAG: 4'-phosphopantetheinyl transferase superfamily protein [Hydrotalea flava]|uniref:4'-phosphopantetheinyl transferase family protein n=1 Tax=Hydrotalea TaxID=1004300 RepID=UPI000943723E|nr:MULTISPECIES: 4'-phosphopantetheinyl transferase superfamily protein [Hydrotalea]MBY0348198.1 4'-phosphopantetheinyl transferase superfamily protein [Hydrotalea flava]RWZ89784.1 MAG: 4'-phosphopantetheinyl transferase superfamily protein [Hydrotalea sp. AMD]